MTRFDPDTVTLGDELDRIAEAYDDTAADLEDMAADNARAQSKQQHLGDLDHMGRELAALIETYGADAEVTLRGLSAGEYAKVENKTAEAASNVDGPSAPGSGRLVFAAAGLLDAPFYDGEPEALQAKIECLAEQPVGVRKWLEDAINERTVADEGNWRSAAGRGSDADSTT